MKFSLPMTSFSQHIIVITKPEVHIERHLNTEVYKDLASVSLFSDFNYKMVQWPLKHHI